MQNFPGLEKTRAMDKLQIHINNKMLALEIMGKNIKSVNVQYNTLVHRSEGTNESSTKRHR